MTQERAIVGFAASVTVVIGIAAFLLVDLIRTEERVATFETEAADIGPLEAVNGAAFTRSKGIAVITEPLAHVRFPFKRTAIGKYLSIEPKFHLDEGDTLEVGVRKTSFWLDYDRMPLAHRILDALLTRDERTWSAIRSGMRIVYVNPRFSSPWQTLDEFEKHPPSDGPIGLYGHAQLACGDNPCTTLPFRISDDPDSFRAIYALYPAPDQTDPEWTVNAQRFDLSNAYRNSDGSIDIMFFVQKKGDPGIRVLVDEVRYRIQPGIPDARALVKLVRRNVARLIRRPPPS